MFWRLSVQQKSSFTKTPSLSEHNLKLRHFPPGIFNVSFDCKHNTQWVFGLWSCCQALALHFNQCQSAISLSFSHAVQLVNLVFWLTANSLRLNMIFYFFRASVEGKDLYDSILWYICIILCWLWDFLKSFKSNMYRNTKISCK